jgi:Lon protease-like protein
MAVLAMFPLGSVLLPGEVLPLHVFEPRYRQLVLDLLADDEHDPEFGVTLIERGHEVGGGDHRAAVGTVARVIRIDALDGGRYALVAVGTRRIRVVGWLPDDPYPLADVDDQPDELPDDPDAVTALGVALAATFARVRAAQHLAVEVGDLAEVPEVELAEAPVLASYQLVSLSPLGPADRHRLLAASGPAERLERLDAALDDVEAVLKFRRR